MWSDICGDWSWSIPLHIWWWVTQFCANHCSWSGSVPIWIDLLMLNAWRTSTRPMWDKLGKHKLYIWVNYWRAQFVNTRYRWSTWRHLCIWHRGIIRVKNLHHNLHGWVLKSLYSAAYIDCTANAFQWPHSLPERFEVFSRLDCQWFGYLSYRCELWWLGCFFLVQARRRSWLDHL
jgi:hypothetical protein